MACKESGIKLVPAVAVTYMMYTVTQPTILRNLSLKLTTKCQTRAASLNPVFLVHGPESSLPIAHLVKAWTLEELRKKRDRNRKPLWNLETCCHVMIPHLHHTPLSLPPKHKTFQKVWLLTFKCWYKIEHIRWPTPLVYLGLL